MHSSYSYSYGASATDAAVGGVALAIFIIPIIFVLVICILSIIANWKIFTKAGEPGWKAIVPYYNIYTLAQISGLDQGLSIVCIFFQPIIIYAMYKLICERFKKSVGFFVLWIFFSPIISLILAFGKDQYIKDGAPTTTQPASDTSETQSNPQVPQM